MSYSTPAFIAFMFAVCAVYSLLGTVGLRKNLLTLASLVFFLWAGLWNVAVFIALTCFSWLCVFVASRSQKQGSKKRAASYFGVFAVFLNFCYWRYYPGVLMPLGLSFSTLQTIAYLIEYDSDQAPLMSFSDYFLFKGFFCQLVAGPIVRASEFLPQIQALRKISSLNAASGISLFVLGLSKKLLIADTIGGVIDPLFNAPANYSPLHRSLAAVAYTVQIWADFSGYTDMGRGAARLLGIELPENFRSPYLSTSLSEFWGRWHITFTTWIKEFLFFPLALMLGRVGAWAIFLALLMTTTLSGLWHGSGVTFAIWGLYHGIALGIEHRFGRRSAGNKLFHGALTFAVVCFGAVIFRSGDVRILRQYFSVRSQVSPVDLAVSWRLTMAIVTAFLIQALFYFDQKTHSYVFVDRLRNFFMIRISSRSPMKIAAFGGVLAGLILLVFFAAIFFQPTQAGNPFIYFQF